MQGGGKARSQYPHIIQLVLLRTYAKHVLWFGALSVKPGSRKANNPFATRMPGIPYCKKWDTVA